MYIGACRSLDHTRAPEERHTYTTADAGRSVENVTACNALIRGRLARRGRCRQSGRRWIWPQAHCVLGVRAHRKSADGRGVVGDSVARGPRLARDEDRALRPTCLAGDHECGKSAGGYDNGTISNG